MPETKIMSLVSARNNFTRIVREVEGGTQVLVTKDRHPAVRIIAEEEYQRMEQRLAVSQLHELADRFRERGLTWKDFYEESREQLENRP